MLIAGDIGGTKTNLALFNEESTDFSAYEHFETFASQDYPDLESILHLYLAEKGGKDQIKGGCFAIAGPVVDEVCRATNLPWIVNARKLSSELNLPHIHLINDLLANAASVEILPKEKLVDLYTPVEIETRENRAVISPGTGLGQAGLFWDGKKYHPFACEGGHTDFAPVNEIQIELFHYLYNKFGHVSYERILSGPGFLNLYQFFVEAKKRKVPQWLSEELEAKNHAAVITENGLNSQSELCFETLNLFVEIFGQECGNLCLKLMALGGMYLGGGIPPKILPKLKEPIFRKGFLNKGRFALLLEKVPLQVIMDNKASLKGAAFFAMRGMHDNCQV